MPIAWPPLKSVRTAPNVPSDGLRFQTMCTGREPNLPPSARHATIEYASDKSEFLGTFTQKAMVCSELLESPGNLVLPTNSPSSRKARLRMPLADAVSSDSGDFDNRVKAKSVLGNPTDLASDTPSMTSSNDQ